MKVSFPRAKASRPVQPERNLSARAIAQLCSVYGISHVLSLRRLMLGVQQKVSELMTLGDHYITPIHDFEGIRSRNLAYIPIG